MVKKILSNCYLTVCLMVLFLLVSLVGYCQPGSGHGNPGGGGVPPVPLSGLEYLIAGGIFAGASRFLKRSKKSNE